MQQPQQHYLYFTKKERNGIVLLLLIVLCLYSLPWMYKHFLKGNYFPPNLSDKIAELDSLQNLPKQKPAESINHLYPENSKQFHSYQKPIVSALFHFDPNTISVDDWKRLGVSEKTATGIRKYIDKGGKFKSADDIKKIWGLNESMKNRLLPFVQIKSSDKIKDSRFTEMGLPHSKNNSEKFSIEINSADSSDLIKIPGIYNSLAGRIIRFRNKLGGFYSIEQFNEIYGWKEEFTKVITGYISIDKSKIKPVLLNKVSVEELKMHPYIRWQLSNVIIAYRSQHGAFRSINDLKKIMLVNDSVFARISPYINVE